MKIRRFTKTDIPQILQIHRASWIKAYKPLIPGKILENLSEIHFQNIWKKNLNNESHSHLVAEQKNRIIGFISFSQYEGSTVYSEISSLYIDPGSAGCGVGKTLINSAFNKLGALGFRKVLLWVVRENQRAIEFYEAVNFRQMNTERKILRHGIELTQLQFSRNIVESTNHATGADGEKIAVLRKGRANL